MLIERANAWITSARCTGSAMSLSVSTFWLSDAGDVSMLAARPGIALIFLRNVYSALMQ